MLKLALLSHILPPSPSGQATILHRLLRTVPSSDYCLISREDYSREDLAEHKGRLPARYYYLPPESQFSRPNRFGLYRVRDLANIVSQVYRRARRVAEVVKQENCGAVMACSGDVIDIPAGYLASRWARVPFYAYLFDDYLYQWTRPLHRLFVKYAEPILIKRAAGVIVPNEFLRDEYRRRYGVEATVIHNPYQTEEAEEETVAGMSQSKDEVRIVYTGAVYHAHFDAFRNLVAAIGQLGQLKVRLHLYTAQPREVLDRENIRGPIVYHDHVSPEEARTVQRRADILFLPLAFVSEIPEVLKTSAPGKMGEYLASGRPILAHAPPWSFVSWYFRKHECGMVVDESEPAALARGIKRILEDEVLRRTMTENSRQRAAVDFSLVVAQTRFLKLLSSERQGV
jgi:glycosyltransferase involved in cell wall biosynthesis